MINGISNLFSGARSVSAKSSPKVSNNFQSLLEATEKTMPKDNVEISGMSYEEKIKELQKLHDQTDYSGMTVVEKYALINKRFEEYFPEFYAINTGLFGEINSQPDGTCIGENPIRVAVTNEMMRQYHDADMKFLEIPEGEVHRQALYPDMTDDEVRAAVMEKYSDGTMADRAGALYELDIMGLLPPFTASFAIDAMRSQIVMNLKGTSQYAGLNTGSPLLESRVWGIVTGTNISWSEIAKAAVDQYGSSSDDKEFIEGLMDDMLNAIIGKER